MASVMDIVNTMVDLWKPTIKAYILTKSRLHRAFFGTFPLWIWMIRVLLNILR